MSKKEQHRSSKEPNKSLQYKLSTDIYEIRLSGICMKFHRFGLKKFGKIRPDPKKIRKYAFLTLSGIHKA